MKSYKFINVQNIEILKLHAIYYKNNRNLPKYSSTISYLICSSDKVDKKKRLLKRYILCIYY